MGVVATTGTCAGAGAGAVGFIGAGFFRRHCGLIFRVVFWVVLWVVRCFVLVVGVCIILVPVAVGCVVVGVVGVVVGGPPVVVPALVVAVAGSDFAIVSGDAFKASVSVIFQVGAATGVVVEAAGVDGAGGCGHAWL